MTMKAMFSLVGAAVVSFSVGCARETPLAPSGLSGVVGLAETSELTTGSTPTVTLLPDLTVSPARVAVRAGYRIMMVNKSGRNASIRSSMCSEFNMMNLPNGGFLNSSVFRPAGKTCDYSAWDDNWSAKIFKGQVVVQ
jgi:hypothetical protein